MGAEGPDPGPTGNCPLILRLHGAEGPDPGPTGNCPLILRLHGAEGLHHRTTTGLSPIHNLFVRTACAILLLHVCGREDPHLLVGH